MSSRKRKKETLSYSERLDPSGTMKRQISDLATLANHPLLQYIGVTQELIEQARSLPTDYELATNLEPVAATLAPLGWCVFARADSSVYCAAAKMAANGQFIDAENILVDHWNTTGDLRVPELRLRQLYTGDDPPRLEVSTARYKLLTCAYELHQAQSYTASIPIVLAQIDGVCADVTHKPAKKLFAKKFFQQRADHLLDNRTVAGHRLGLASLNAVFCKDTANTNTGDALSRHGIMHGRVLGYGTLNNSTKAFVALHALLEWAWAELWSDQSAR